MDLMQTFSMTDFDCEPPRLIVEITYPKEMFDLEIANEQGEPIEITLREKNGYFVSRQGKSGLRASDAELKRLRQIEEAAKRFDSAGSTVHQMSPAQWEAYTDLKALFHGGIKSRS